VLYSGGLLALSANIRLGLKIVPRTNTSLLRTFVNYGRKKFYNFGPWPFAVNYKSVMFQTVYPRRIGNVWLLGSWQFFLASLKLVASIECKGTAAPVFALLFSGLLKEGFNIWTDGSYVYVLWMKLSSLNRDWEKVASAKKGWDNHLLFLTN
jgi:hypothetical protein